MSRFRNAFFFYRFTRKSDHLINKSFHSASLRLLTAKNPDAEYKPSDFRLPAEDLAVVEAALERQMEARFESRNASRGGTTVHIDERSSVQVPRSPPSIATQLTR